MVAALFVLSYSPSYRFSSPIEHSRVYLQHFFTFSFNSHTTSILIFSFRLTDFHHITPIETPRVTMNYYIPPSPSGLSPSLYSPTTEGGIVCGSNMNARLPLSSSGIMSSSPVNFDDMFPEASHSSLEPAVRNIVIFEGTGC